MIELKKGGLEITLCEPWTYYQGVRFDHSGVFRRIVKDGYRFADEWFAKYDPHKHDAVCGCAEEFVTDFKPGEQIICKPGVGLLRNPYDAPFDFFKDYEILDKGQWSLEQEDDTCLGFRQRLDGWYDYEKTVRLLSEDSFEIRHALRWTSKEAYGGFSYNHNFFTFGLSKPGPSRSVEFPFRPEGNWRSEYSCVGLTENGIRFSAPVEPPSVYMGNLRACEGPTLYEATLSELGHRVHLSCCSGADGVPSRVDHFVFWANPDVACIEPYLRVDVRQGEEFNWTLNYKLINES